MTNNKSVLAWLDEMKELVTPDEVVWIDGSEEQLESLRKQACETGEMIKLNEEKLPGCYLHRTAVNDVARVEGRTFICSHKEEDAGPTNHWMEPEEAYKMLFDIARGSYKGRTMYVIPYSMGPVGSPLAKIGMEVTDSIYVVLNMAIMTRVGTGCAGRAGRQRRLGEGPALQVRHRRGEALYHATSPRTTPSSSVNSGYGGNVLLGKKCFALRIASYLGKNEGWMAEHMLILGIENPKGEVKYVTAAFPSACGKTNLAMLIPPEGYPQEGLQGLDRGRRHRLDAHGRRRPAVGHQPRERLLRRGPRHQHEVQPQRFDLHPEGHHLHQRGPQPGRQHRLVGRPGQESARERSRLEGRALERQDLRRRRAPIPTAASPLPPRTAPASALSSTTARACRFPPSSSAAAAPRPLPWCTSPATGTNGVFVGSIMASETTAAATGAVGVVRRDPMAMLPFCGYHMGDYFQHWLEMGEKLGDKAPKIFNVNWFRTRRRRPLHLARLRRQLPCAGVDPQALRGRGGRAWRPPSAMCPRPRTSTWRAFRTSSIETLKCHPGSGQGCLWLKEAEGIEEFYKQFGDKLPQELRNQLETLKKNCAE